MSTVFYPSTFNPPGAATTVASSVPQGGYCVYPNTTRSLPRQQPPGEVLPPGRFTTANTKFGGECFYPATTRQLRPQQPPGECLPPGRFTAAPNTTQGGTAFYPATMRRLNVQQSQGVFEVRFPVTGGCWYYYRFIAGLGS